MGERVKPPSPGRRFATLTLARGALVALGLALLAGACSALYHVPAIGTAVSPWVDLTTLRPLHTVFGAAFITLGGLAVVHRYLEDEAGPIDGTERWRLRIMLVSWAVAGLGVLGTLPLGLTSGREYVGYHPVWSVPIALGWLAFTWSFFAATWRGFWQRPLYVTMWGIGCLFFLWTFAEQHLWLLPDVFADPVVDRRLQLKATGSLVGAINFFVYGAVLYIGERMSGDENWARSRLAHALFFVSLVNSLTNYVHHTYHLPQSHWPKVVAFAITMTEVIILFQAMRDLVKVMKARCPEWCATTALFGAAKGWTAAVLFSAILMSIPPLNSLIHGTLLITGHAMAGMLGIDTMLLLGVLTALLGERLVRARGEGADAVLNTPRLRTIVIGANVSAAAFIGWLHLVGVATGVGRYLTPRNENWFQQRPEWLTELAPLVLAGTGLATFAFLIAGLAIWLQVAFRAAPAEARQETQAPAA